MKIPTPFSWIIRIVSLPYSAQTLVIGLYDYADLSDKETVRLTDTTSLMFAHSDIHVVWRYCRGVSATAPATTCRKALQFNEIAVLLQPSAPPSSGQGKTLHLGHAFVTAGGGHYASVFVPAVRAQVAEFGVAFDLLIGCAVAHEGGHCLLGPRHSYVGIMRGAWTRKDAEEISRLGLHFTRQENRKAAARLVRVEPAVQR